MEEEAISEAVEVEEEVEAVEAEEEQPVDLDLIDDSMELDSQIITSKSNKCLLFSCFRTILILIFFVLGQKALVPKQSQLLKTK